MKTALPSRVAVGTLALVLVVGGCSTTATIERRDGPPTEGRIERSDQGALYVSDGDGRIMRIERRQVEDIDHPGNIAFTVGAFLTTMLVGAVAGALVDNPRQMSVPTAAAFIAAPLALGVGGGYFYFRSKSAARAYETAPRYIIVGPRKPTFELEDFRMPPPAGSGPSTPSGPPPAPSPRTPSPPRTDG
jgi:hypothetical protein